MIGNDALFVEWFSGENIPRCKRKDCFAYLDSHTCRALREVIPKDCSFYKPRYNKEGDKKK